MMSAMTNDLEQELFRTRRKQARLKYQVRHMQRQLTRLRAAAKEAIELLDAGEAEKAQEVLDDGFTYASVPMTENFNPQDERQKLEKMRGRDVRERSDNSA